MESGTAAASPVCCASVCRLSPTCDSASPACKRFASLQIGTTVRRSVSVPRIVLPLRVTTCEWARLRLKGAKWQCNNDHPTNRNDNKGLIPASGISAVSFRSASQDSNRYRGEAVRLMVGIGGKASCLTGLASCRAGSPCPALAPRSRVEWTPNPALPPPWRNIDAAPGKRRGGRGGCVTSARAETRAETRRQHQGAALEKSRDFRPKHRPERSFHEFLSKKNPKSPNQLSAPGDWHR